MLLAFVGCSDQDDLVVGQKIVGLKASKNQFSIVLQTDLQKQVKVKSSIEGGRLYSKMFFNDGNGDWVEYSVFNIDLSDKQYRSTMNLVVKEKAGELRDKMDMDFVNSVENALEQLSGLLYDKLGKEFFLETSQSFFFPPFDTQNNSKS